jgi:hypothetical protein
MRRDPLDDLSTMQVRQLQSGVQNPNGVLRTVDSTDDAVKDHSPHGCRLRLADPHHVVF